MSEKFEKFTLALETVRKHLYCAVCKQIAKCPLLLKNCHHIICQSDYKRSVKNCPECGSAIEISDLQYSGFETLITSNETLFDYLGKIKENLQKTNREDFNSKSSDNQVGNQTKVNKNKIERSTDNLNISTISSYKNCNIKKKNSKGETLLHIACRSGQESKVKELLEIGANPNTKDYAGWTPLHEAVQGGFVHITQLLLKHYALVNVPGPANETALHEAVRYKNKDIVKILIEHGADPQLRNIKDETPYQLADAIMKKLLKNQSNAKEQQTIEHVTRLNLVMDGEEMRIFCFSQSKIVKDKLKDFKSHSNMHIESKFNSRVTHLIVDCDQEFICESSNYVLQAIAKRIWVISSKWVLDSKAEESKCFKDYEIRAVGAPMYNGPYNARMNRYKMLPGIFNSCHIYLHGFNTSFNLNPNLVISKAFLVELIKSASGVVLIRAPNPESIPEVEKIIPYHAKKEGKLSKCAHYIIYKDDFEPKYNMAHLKALPVGWLIECIEKYELCEPW